MILYNSISFWKKLAKCRAWTCITIIDKEKGQPVRAHFEDNFRVHVNGVWRQFDSWEELCDAYIVPREVCIGGKKFKGNFDCEYFDDIGRPDGSSNWGRWEDYFRFKTSFMGGV